MRLSDTGRPGLQVTSGSGGWPMSAFLTPDLLPFYGGALLARGAAAGAGLPASESWGRRGGRACFTWDDDVVLAVGADERARLPTCAPHVRVGAALFVQRGHSP